MNRVYLTEEELILILVQALVKARALRSEISKDGVPKIHVAISGTGKRGRVHNKVVHSDDEDEEMKKNAMIKAALAHHHSTDNLAMSSHAVSHRDAQKRGISTKGLKHAGGIPLYKNRTLVGSVGVSGDAPEVNEAVALAASQGFESAEEIRSDKVLGIPFKNSVLTESALKNPEFQFSMASLPPLPASPTLRGSVSPSIHVLPPLKRTSPQPSPLNLPLLPSAGTFPLTRNSPTRLPDLPKLSPKVSPKKSPKVSPKVSPKKSPKVSPKVSPKKSPKLPDLPKLSPKVSPKKSPKLPDLPKLSPKLSPKKSPKLSPKKSPKVSQKMTTLPMVSPKRSPKKSPRSLALSSPTLPKLPPLAVSASKPTVLGTSLTSLAPSGIKTNTSFFPPSPQPLKTSLPSLSKLTPMQK